MAKLVTLVERQPGDFRLVWDWTPLRKLLTESRLRTISSRRESLAKLILAVDAENKAVILAGLKEVHGAFEAWGEAPGKPPKG